MATVSCEIKWLHHLLQDFGVPHSQPALLYCDNKSAIYIAENPVFHERTKHIEIDCHLIRDKVQDGSLKLFHVKTEHQLADIFTKSLTGSRHHLLTSKLGLCDIHIPTCGGMLKLNPDHTTAIAVSATIEHMDQASSSGPNVQVDTQAWSSPFTHPALWIRFGELWTPLSHHNDYRQMP